MFRITKLYIRFFYSTSLCQGPSIVFSPLSLDLMPSDGTHYYITEETAKFTLQDGGQGPARPGFCVLEEKKADHTSGSIYLQGTRSGDVFLDDFGREITYFKWEDGEPATGNYIPTDSDTNLQKTSSGRGFKQFICRVY